MISSDIIAHLCNEVDSSRAELRKLLYSEYMLLVKDMASKYHFDTGLWESIMLTDFAKSQARTATKYGYHRPQLLSINDENSHIHISNLRHPIIERLIDMPYVTNDVGIGQTNENNWAQGILLFGINDTGKSSLIKAVALNVIMAQAGCYTAGQVVLRPYKRLITRLSGHDNIFSGESSGIIELTELRTILRNSDKNTLVLGDELCRGTEIPSSTGFTVAAIEHLIKVRASFLFATHMHHVVNIPAIKGIASNILRIAHLKVHYDEKSGLLLHNRKLAEGAGDTLYGLEVAKSLHFKSDFLDRVGEIRRYIIGQSDNILTTKTSRYNKEVYMEKCSRCSSTENLHTHHILPQKDANTQGLIEHVHKDIKGNLVVLCDKCHAKVHKDDMNMDKKESVGGAIIFSIEE